MHQDFVIVLVVFPCKSILHTGVKHCNIIHATFCNVVGAKSEISKINCYTPAYKINSKTEIEVFIGVFIFEVF